MLHKILFMMIIMAWANVPAQAASLTDGTYFPGYISYQVPLSLFVPARVASACAMLMHGDLEKAEDSFAGEIRQHPEDLAAYVGFLQAARGHRDAYLSRYEREAQTDNSPANEFKLGMLAFYLQAELAAGTNQDKTLDSRTLAQMAVKKLHLAYIFSHAPVAGFAYEEILSYTGGGDGLQTWEDMILRLGGSQIYRTYFFAKTHHWNGPQPTIPRLQGNNLLIFRYIVGSLVFTFSEQVGNVGTQAVGDTTRVYVKNWSPISADHQAALDYLTPWRQRLIRAIQTEKSG